jgi:hypothetical protein
MRVKSLTVRVRNIFKSIWTSLGSNSNLSTNSDGWNLIAEADAKRAAKTIDDCLNILDRN